MSNPEEVEILPEQSPVDRDPGQRWP